MLHIKEVEVIYSESVKVMFTLDEVNDIVLLAQLLSPLAKTIFVEPLGGHANNVYCELVEKVKRLDKKHGLTPVYMVELSKLTYGDPDEESGIRFYENVNVDMVKVSETQDIFNDDSWKHAWKKFSGEE